MSNSLTFTINSVDQTAKVLLESFYLRYKRNSLPVAFFKLANQLYIPATVNQTFPVVITDDDTSAQLFTGYLKNTDAEIITSSAYFLEAACAFINEPSLLNNAQSGDYSSGAYNEKQILEDIMGSWSPDPITTHVITGSLTAIKWNDASPQRMLDDLAAANDRYYYWDGDGELHYFASTGEAAPFGLSDSPNESTTFSYGKLRPTIDYLSDSVTNVYGGTLVCWKAGLMPGMALQITNAVYGWSAESFIIDEVTMRYKGSGITWEYEIHFGASRKRKVSDLIVRSNQAASTVDRGLVAALENDTTKYYRSDGTWAVVSGGTPDAHHTTHETGGSDVVTPTTHASRHQSGGADSIKLDDLAAPDDNADLNASTSKHGLLLKGTGNTSYFLRADCAWAIPSGGHTQNTDTILTTNGSTALINAGVLKTTLQVDANQIIRGLGYLTIETSTASDQLLIRNTGITSSIVLDNYAQAGSSITIRAYNNIWLFSAAGSLILPLRTSDPAGTSTEGAVYYHSTNHVIRHYNGSVWGDIGLSSHALDGSTYHSAPTDITTYNASTSAHGLLLKATAPASGLLNVVGIGNGETVYACKALFDNTNPAALGTAAPGTSLVAARRDHVHAAPAAHGFTKSAELGGDSTRVCNVTYGGQSYAMIITVTIASSAAAGYQVNVLSDSSNPPTTVILLSSYASATYEPITVTFVVPAGHYYKVTATGTGEYVVYWYEYIITT